MNTNKILLTLLISVFCGSASGQSPDFFDRVIVDAYGPTNYFIPVQIRSESYSGNVVIQSGDLFEYLKATRGFNARAYKSFMLKLLKEKQPIAIKGVKTDKSGFFLTGKPVKERTFRVIKPSQAFETVASQGCQRLIHHYFWPDVSESNTANEATCIENIKYNRQDLLIRPRYDLAEQNNVIARLFEMEIPISLDDISGSLKIAHMTLR